MSYLILLSTTFGVRLDGAARFFNSSALSESWTLLGFGFLLFAVAYLGKRKEVPGEERPTVPVLTVQRSLDPTIG